MIINKHPRPDQYNSSDKGVYRSLVAQTRVKSFPNRTDGARPHAAWKWKYMLKKMVIPGERITEEEEESEETDDASDTTSIGDTNSPDITSPASTRKALGEPSSSDMPITSPLHTRSYGKANKEEGYEVVYLSGYINGLAKKLHLLAAEFFADNTTVRKELVQLKQLTRFAVRRYKYGGSGIVSTIGSLLARYATKALLTTAANTALRGKLDSSQESRSTLHFVFSFRPIHPSVTC